MDLRAVTRKLTQIYDQALISSGISVTQFSQLHLIQSTENPTLKRLAEAGGLDRSTLGRNLRVLEKMQLVTMTVGEDARTRMLQITPKGKAAFNQAAPEWHAVQKNLKERLGHNGRDQLNHLLGELTGASQ